MQLLRILVLLVQIVHALLARGLVLDGFVLGLTLRNHGFGLVDDSIAVEVDDTALGGLVVDVVGDVLKLEDVLLTFGNEAHAAELGVVGLKLAVYLADGLGLSLQDHVGRGFTVVGLEVFGQAEQGEGFLFLQGKVLHLLGFLGLNGLGENVVVAKCLSTVETVGTWVGCARKVHAFGDEVEGGNGRNGVGRVFLVAEAGLKHAVFYGGGLNGTFRLQQYFGVGDFLAVEDGGFQAVVVEDIGVTALVLPGAGNGAEVTGDRKSVV